jgi:hypothetical protein
MKKLKKVSEIQYWQVIGLLSLAKSHYKQLLYIEEAIADTLGIEGMPTDYGHISDMIWNGEVNADKLLKNEGIEQP